MEIKSIRNVNRFRRIAWVLVKYGFDDIIDRLELPGSFLLRRIARIKAPLTTNERIRLVFQELGPTFIKFGQILSMRPDLVPGPLLLELKKLQDRVPPAPTDAVRTLLARTLQRPPEQIFSDFDWNPLGSASLAQVYRARLAEGGLPVAVKIQRPGIRPLIYADLDILGFIAERLNELRNYEPYNFPGLVEELRYSLIRELDFSREARNMKIFKNNLSFPELMYIPEVYEKFTTPYVVTMELVEGTRLDQLQNLQVDRQTLARNGAKIMLDQMLRHGYFHADPHLGNLLVMDDGRLCFLDWGMTGRITREMRERLIELIKALVEKDSETVLRLVPYISAEFPADLRTYRLERDIQDLIDAYYGLSLKEVQLGQLILDLMSLLKDHRLRVRSDFALLGRALLSLEGLGQELYPPFNTVEEARPLLAELVRERWSIQHISEGLQRQLRDLADLMNDMPARLKAFFWKVDKGDLTLTFRHTGLKGLNDTLETISNRVT
ncbi:MAG: phosphotransferase, partial [Deltaproteobacteria bacterium]|nr:phosphotransferase [Deltaproteobacteria bacterium]